jgi:hypothetical protein
MKELWNQRFLSFAEKQGTKIKKKNPSDGSYIAQASSCPTNVEPTKSRPPCLADNYRHKSDRIDLYFPLKLVMKWWKRIMCSIRRITTNVDSHTRGSNRVLTFELTDSKKVHNHLFHPFLGKPINVTHHPCQADQLWMNAPGLMGFKFWQSRQLRWVRDWDGVVSVDVTEVSIYEPDWPLWLSSLLASGISLVAVIDGLDWKAYSYRSTCILESSVCNLRVGSSAYANSPTCLQRTSETDLERREFVFKSK